MLEKDLLYKFKDALYRLLEETGVVRTVEIALVGASQDLYQPDMILSLKIDGQKYKVVVEVKSIGQPRFIRIAAQQLTEYMAANPDVAYGIFAVPYLSEDGRQLCRRYGIGYIDLAGNSRLTFDNLYIDIQGRENPYPTTRGLKSLFTKKSTRAIRVLLSDLKKFWYVQDLAKEADLSLGQVSNIKRLLIDEDLLQEEGKPFRLADPERLIDAWVQNYSFRYNESFDFYSLEGTQIERKIASFCKEKGITYALALFSGANLVAPFVRYTRSFVYLEEGIFEVAKQLNLKEVTSGPNVTLLRPYDKGVFYGIQEVNGISVVSDVQLYLDLKKYRGRGEEAAQYILENRLRRAWQ
jgi:hypothetical protein